MSIDGYRIRRVDGNAARDHDLDVCHDDMHVDGDSCPDCGGYRTGGTAADVTHQTPSDAEAKTATPSGTEAGAPGREVEPRSPAAPSRPSPTDRVTWNGPLAVEQDITDDDWTVIVGLTDDARRQLARDLARKHMSDLILLNRMCIQERMYRHTGAEADEANARDVARTIENRLSGALQSMGTTQWTLTPAQAEQLTDDLEDAQADPEPCAVGTCSAYSIDGSSYCAPHDEGI